MKVVNALMPIMCKLALCFIKVSTNAKSALIKPPKK